MMFSAEYVIADPTAAGWQFLQSHRRALLKFAYDIVQDTDTAEEWVQEISVKIPKLANEWDCNRGTPFVPYMLYYCYFYLRHCNQRRAREHKRFGKLVAQYQTEEAKAAFSITTNQSPDVACIITGDISAILEKVGRVDAELRTVLEEYYINRISVKQIAAKYRTTRPTITAMIREAITVARRNL